MKGVLDLCLHTALAHVRFTVGDAFPTLSYICDDNIEGTVAELNRYFNRRTNNVSRCQSLINRKAMDPITFMNPKGRSPAELLLLNKELVVCPCVARLRPSSRDGIKAFVRFPRGEPALSVAAETSTLDGTEESVDVLVSAAQ